jgi:putative photosynthetic complex assembly protein
MSDASVNRPFPRGPLIGAAALIAMSLVAAGTARLTRTHTTVPPAAVVAARYLRFEDRPDHGVAVYDIRGDRPIAVVPPGTNGFLRAALRGLARDRKRDGGSGAAPFRLTALADGRLTLQDTVTGDRVELEAFGEANEAAFARLLTAREATQ